MSRRKRLALLGGAALAIALAGAGCPAAHGGYPDKTCMIDSDCYQGEVCGSSMMCVLSPKIDLAMPMNGDLSTAADLSPPVDLAGVDQ